MDKTAIWSKQLTEQMLVVLTDQHRQFGQVIFEFLQLRKSFFELRSRFYQTSLVKLLSFDRIHCWFYIPWIYQLMKTRHFSSITAR